jgi:hypothetical protein
MSYPALFVLCGLLMAMSFVAFCLAFDRDDEPYPSVAKVSRKDVA